MKKLFFRLVLVLAVFAIVLQANAQSRTITGVVRDAAGEPLAGVTVSVKNADVNAVSDVDGKYSIQVPEGSNTLVFSFVGKNTQEFTIKAANSYNIVLEDDAATLDAVVISTGYMTQRKADLTGAVSVVTRNDFIKNPSANVLRSLQGKVPGMMITTNGNPAEQVGIQMRGLTSINASPPLIVLDGQPITINLRDINPNDIESIQVLKDAASASIYGSRAAGGVILITTKQGTRGDIKVTYDAYVGMSRLPKLPEMLDAEGYGRAIWQATVNDGNNPDAIQYYNFDWGYDQNGIPVLNNVSAPQWLNAAQTMPYSNTNWWKEGTRTGIQQNHQITLQGGNERLKSLFSLNYYNNQGTQITSFFRRLSARFNNEYQIAKGRLTIGENLTVTNLRMRDVNSTYDFIIMPPNIPVYDNNGGWGGVAMPLGMDDYNNPIRVLKLNEDNVPNFMKVLGSAYANLKILDNLQFRTQYGIDYSMWYERIVDKKWVEAGGKRNDFNGVRQNTWHNLGRTWTNTLTYNLTFGKSQLDALAGAESYSFIVEDLNAYRQEILLENRDYAYLNATTSTDNYTIGGGGDERRMLSYFGKLNYSFDSKYLLSFTLRRDGASVFGANNRWGTFPAVSAGWRISDEKFMQGQDIVSDFKLRGSWGQNGNQAPLNAGRLVNLYVTDLGGTSYPINGNTGDIPSGYKRARLGNPDLKWETTTQLNIGADFGFFNNRLRGSFDWFDKKTTGILYEPPYIAALGEGGYRWINAVNLANQGFELVLSWGESKKDFSYTITTNFSAYRNRMGEVPEVAKYAFGGNGLLDHIQGRSRNSYYGLVADGIFRTQEELDNSATQVGKGLGRIRYKDLDGDGVISEIYDRTWIGVSDPDLMAGLNFEARYKNFDITMFFQGVFGNEIYNNWKELSDFWNIAVQNDRNHPARILNAWSPNNPNSNIPALSRGDANGEKRMSSYYIENGSYFKFRTIDIGYTVPRSVIDRWGMQNLRLYLSAQNVFRLTKTWGDDRFTGLDPETGFNYPLPFNAFFGVNVTF